MPVRAEGSEDPAHLWPRRLAGRSAGPRQTRPTTAPVGPPHAPLYRAILIDVVRRHTAYRMFYEWPSVTSHNVQRRAGTPGMGGGRLGEGGLGQSGALGS